MTNCGFNKNGDKFITGSYDRTCKVWETETGNLLHTLEGHKNAVYSMAFNVPFGYLLLKLEIVLPLALSIKLLKFGIRTLELAFIHLLVIKIK